MADVNKKIFLSYRRSLSKYAARSVYQHLKQQGYDIFMDVESIDSGEFTPVILHQIEARPHFIIILTPGVLDRTRHANDWVRREIEHALDKKRNIIPVLMEGFNMDLEEKKLPNQRLPGKLSSLKKYNYLDVPDSYFEAAMERLTSRYLKIKAKAPVIKTPKDEVKQVKEMIKLADQAEIDTTKNLWIFPEYKPLVIPLKSPKLSASPGLIDFMTTLKWSEVLGASNYVLEMSFNKSFNTAQEIYNGNKNSHIEYSFSNRLQGFSEGLIGLNYLQNLSPTAKYFRVKAQGKLIYSDSPWSNIVEVKPPTEKTSLKAPKLESKVNEQRQGYTDLKWSAVSGAAGYVLEMSYTPSFDKASEAYNGTEKQFEDFSFPSISTGLSSLSTYSFGAFKMVKYYRVKAKGKGNLSDSDWSNTIEIEPPKQVQLEAPVLELSKKLGSVDSKQLRWSKILFATQGYILEKSYDKNFTNASVLYDGTDTYFDLDILPSFLMAYYRVKAVGLSFTGLSDSPWSNVLSIPPGYS